MCAPGPTLSRLALTSWTDSHPSFEYLGLQKYTIMSCQPLLFKTQERQDLCMALGQKSSEFIKTASEPVCQTPPTLTCTLLWAISPGVGQLIASPKSPTCKAQSMKAPELLYLGHLAPHPSSSFSLETWTTCTLKTPSTGTQKDRSELFTRTGRGITHKYHSPCSLPCCPCAV